MPLKKGYFCERFVTFLFLIIAKKAKSLVAFFVLKQLFYHSF